MDVTPFRFDTAEIRTLTINGQPWFVGRDVAVLLGYSNSVDALNRHCRGAVKHSPLMTEGGVQDMRVIAEPDLWRLVVGSSLPTAVEIERWIFEEVLPAVRHDGRNEVARVDEVPARDHPMVTQFWNVYGELELAGERVNFSGNKATVAVRINDFRQRAYRRGLELAPQPQLGPLLKTCVTRPFVVIEHVPFRGARHQCWVFRDASSTSNAAGRRAPVGPAGHAYSALPTVAVSSNRRKLAEQCDDLGLRFGAMAHAAAGLSSALRKEVLGPAQAKTLVAGLRHDLRECIDFVEAADFG